MRHTLVPFCVLIALATPVLAEDGRHADLTPLVKGNNAFAVDLYARLCQQKGNLLFSPHSISTALAMTRAGARGETAAEMDRVLHFDLPQQRLHRAFAGLTRELNGHGLPRNHQLQVANSLWREASLNFRDDFRKVIRDNYGAGLRSVDFARHPNTARKQVNRWVEDRTNDRIKELLQEGDVTRLTRLVLVNALYFKSAWQHPFDPTLTRKDARFEVSPGKSVTAALMTQVAKVGYLEDDTCQAIELPYEDGEASLLVVLPRKKVGMASLEAKLTAKKLAGWIAGLEPRDVNLSLPRFKIESRCDLAETLSRMGMPAAFKPGKADFSGMTDEAKLHISKVIHKAFVNLDEEGTEAAAATAVVMAIPASPPPPKAKIFTADHPFLVVLRDTRSGAILFMGRVTDPSPVGTVK